MHWHADFKNLLRFDSIRFIHSSKSHHVVWYHRTPQDYMYHISLCLSYIAPFFSSMKPIFAAAVIASISAHSAWTLENSAAHSSYLLARITRASRIILTIANIVLLVLSFLAAVPAVAPGTDLLARLPGAGDRRRGRGGRSR